MGFKVIALLTFSLIILTRVAAGAPQVQTTPTPSPQQDLSTKSKTSEPSTQASNELRNLTNSLSGKWSLSVKFEPNPEMPAGFAGIGEETWSAGPGGYTLLEDEHIPTPAGDVYLLGLIWKDGPAQSLRGMECNNQLPFTCDLKGALNDITLSWDGKQLVLSEWETHAGKKTLWHEVWSEITPTSFVQTGEIQVPGGATTRFFTMKARKVK
jgi:hypothetical protein